MKKNNLMVLMFFTLIIFLMGGCSKTNENSTSYTNKSGSESITLMDNSGGNIIDLKSNFKDLLDNSDAIAAGKVIKSYSYKLNNAIFTNYVVNVERQFKKKDKDLPSQIEIRFT